MALDLSDLSKDEQLALVALERRTIAADRYTSDDEVKQIRNTIAALGKKTYRALAEEADQRFTEEGDLWKFVAAITRPRAREVIYEAVLEAALADAPQPVETELIDRLGTLWHIKPRVVDPPR